MSRRPTAPRPAAGDNKTTGGGRGNPTVAKTALLFALIAAVVLADVIKVGEYTRTNFSPIRILRTYYDRRSSTV